MKPSIHSDNSMDVCDFHHDKSHRRNDCVHLKDAIEFEIYRRQLQHFVARQGQPYWHRNWDREALGSRGVDKGKGKQITRGIINVIIGTNEEWITSNTERKTYLHSKMSMTTSVKNP